MSAGAADTRERWQSLVDEQRQAFLGLRRVLEQWAAGGAAPGPSVAALIGARGVGKTTILRELREITAPSFVATEIIDASVVREDFGLVAATIEALHQSVVRGRRARPAHDLHAAPGGRAEEPWDDLHKRLEDKYEECLEAALLQEESHRKLAQDLAMSPGHYGTLVREAVRKKRLIPEQIGEYLKLLRAAHRRLRDWPAEGPPFVVYIDDLDLADPKQLQSFVRSILTDYANVKGLSWVLAFDRGRMIPRLSDRGDEGGEPDLHIGRAQLTKLVPFHHQHELRGWSFEERRGFRRLPEGKDELKLDKLLANAGLVELLPILPPQPRALEGIYSWLHDAVERELVPSVEAGIRKVALASGEFEIEQQLVHWGAARLATTFEWAPDTTLSRRSWAELASAAGSDDPVWGLPLPRAFDPTVSGTVPEAYLEALLDIALRAGEMTPYQLLVRLSFARRELTAARISRTFSDEEIGLYLARPPPSRVAAVAWQEWHEEGTRSRPQDKGKLWGASIGPAALWQVVYGLRSPVPTDLLQGLYLPRDVFDAVSTGMPRDLAPRDGAPLPCRTRALVLLISGVVRAPWREVEAAWGFWSPLSATRAMAALTLSAYAWGIWGDERGAKRPALHAAATESASSMLELSEARLREEYASFLRWLGEKCEGGPIKPDGLGRVAQAELLRALRAMLALPAVRGIAEE
jgi:hypothetical protein